MKKFEIPEKVKKLSAYEPNMKQFDVRLDANESFVGLPMELREKIAMAVLSADFNRYPDPLAAKVCGAFAAYHSLDAECVTAGNGSDELISIIINSLLEKGDKLLCFTPDFSMYSFYSSLAECVTVTLPNTGDRKMLEDALNTVRNEGISAVIFSNPCNPTGTALSSDEILKFVSECGCLVIIDEAYMDFFDQSILHKASEFDNLIVLRTCSKAVGLAAIRLGFAVACSELTAVLKKCKSPYNVNLITQLIGEIVLSDKEYLETAKQLVLNSRDQLSRIFDSLSMQFKGKFAAGTTAANFFYIKAPNDKQLEAALADQGIAVRAFGNGYLRINCGSTAENEKLESCLKNILGGMQ